LIQKKITKVPVFKDLELSTDQKNAL